MFQYTLAVAVAQPFEVGSLSPLFLNIDAYTFLLFLFFQDINLIFNKRKKKKRRYKYQFWSSL